MGGLALPELVDGLGGTRALYADGLGEKIDLGDQWEGRSFMVEPWETVDQYLSRLMEATGCPIQIVNENGEELQLTSKRATSHWGALDLIETIGGKKPTVFSNGCVTTIDFDQLSESSHVNAVDGAVRCRFIPPKEEGGIVKLKFDAAPPLTLVQWKGAKAFAYIGGKRFEVGITASGIVDNESAALDLSAIKDKGDVDKLVVEATMVGRPASSLVLTAFEEGKKRELITEHTDLIYSGMRHIKASGKYRVALQVRFKSLPDHRIIKKEPKAALENKIGCMVIGKSGIIAPDNIVRTFDGSVAIWLDEKPQEMQLLLPDGHKDHDVELVLEDIPAFMKH